MAVTKLFQCQESIISGCWMDGVGREVMAASGVMLWFSIWFYSGTGGESDESSTFNLK